MGASASTNVAKVAVNSITKIASDIVQNTNVTAESSQIVSVTNADGDVVIDGNVLRQTATVNMQALFNAMSSEDAQQKLAVEIAQQAKAVTSGLNLAQFSASTNILDTLISATIDLSSKIGQTCALSLSQRQSITVDRVRGTTRIVNNVLEQVADLLQDCVSTAVNNSKAIQDVSARLTQTATASSIGLSEWALALMGAVVLGVPVVGGIVGGVYALKYIFPITLVVGLCVVAYYVYASSNAMTFTLFSSLISDSPECSAVPLTGFPPATSVQQAASACLANDKCAAVDFKSYTVSDTGRYAPLRAPIASYYSDVECKEVKPDGVSLVRIPMLFRKNTQPVNVDGAIQGDVYVDTSTSNWYQMDDAKVWHLKSRLIVDEFNSLIVSGRKPGSALMFERGKGDKQYYIYSDPISMSHWTVYKKDVIKNRWVEQLTQPGPGLYVVVPPVSNTTAFKTRERKQWLLYVGIAIAVVGLGGTVFTLANDQKSKDSRVASSNRA